MGGTAGSGSEFRQLADGPRLHDYPERGLQIAVARLLDRNPAIPAWRRRWIRGWQTDAPDSPGPSAPPGREPPLLFGITAVWNEGDIVHATVRNLVDEGADAVFVLDDESDDETADEARAAGATVIPFASRGVYSEAERAARMQHLMRSETDRAGGDAWWVIADADEFPRGPSGSTIRELIETLPGWVDMVGSRVLDHFPLEPEGYRAREHPLASMPLAQWCASPYCPRGHWKHQLIRLRDGDDLWAAPGHHAAGAGDGRRLREAGPDLLMHHVPYRNRGRTEGRLRRAAGPGGRFTLSPDRFIRWRVRQRLDAMDAIYGQHFDRVPSFYAGRPRFGVAPRDWRDLVPADERDVAVR